MDQVRRAENKRLRAAGDERLSGTKYNWLRHPASFSEDTGHEFQARRESDLKTARAWVLKRRWLAVSAIIQNIINAICFHCGGLDMAPGH